MDNLIRLISQPWAIHPEVLENWCQILDAKLGGLALPAELAASARNGGGSGDELFVRDGNLAIVPVVGTLVKRNTLFSCDATYNQVQQAVAAAVADSSIDGILLDGDSPGGTVAGAQETGDFIYRANQQKPVYGWVDDLAASAGYWLMAQTRSIGAHPAADIGSIGVITVHYDRSGRDEQAGIKRSVLAVGDYKASGADTGPLSGEDRAYILERLNQTYDLFIAAVIRQRQMSAEHIRGLQSRIFKAAQAKETGLIDHIMGRDEYIGHVKKQLKGSVSSTISKGAFAMNLEQLNAEHPDLVDQIRAEARQGMVAQADHETALASARGEAATEARQPVLDLASAVFGEELGGKFTAAVEAGLTAETASALGVSFAPQAAAGNPALLEALQAAAAEPVSGAKPAAAGESEARKAAVSAIASGGSIK